MILMYDEKNMWVKSVVDGCAEQEKEWKTEAEVWAALCTY